MGCDVFANGDEIACKAGDGKVIASFPDVCLTPPPPPAGPIPVPYPDSSFSKDMQSGSKTVQIKDQEVMLKDQSFYKTSPLGDEAATNGQGANVVTHVITGKTFFTAWSMDVKFEGENVDRNLDVTTSNHASAPPGCGTPNPNLSAKKIGKIEDETGICQCCKKPIHSRGAVMNYSEYYGLNKTSDGKPPHPSGSNLAPEAIHARTLTDLAKNKKANGCTCNAKVLPEPPCNVFRKLPPPGPGQTKSPDKIKIDSAFKRAKPGLQALLGVPSEAVVTAQLQAKLKRLPSQAEVESERKINHLTPRAAGGCPTGKGNLQEQTNMCSTCRTLDGMFNPLQK